MCVKLLAATTNPATKKQQGDIKCLQLAKHKLLSHLSARLSM